jgi:hypothetical protein
MISSIKELDMHCALFGKEIRVSHIYTTHSRGTYLTGIVDEDLR